MSLQLTEEIAALQRMAITQLRQKHIDLFGEQTRSGNKPYLIKRMAWRLQANAQGNLPQRARQRAEQLANDSDLRTHAPRDKPNNLQPSAGTKTAPVHFNHDSRVPMPGAILTRLYKDRDILVKVRPDGFEWENTIYRSLSAVAKAITGQHWNGYHFFNLTQNQNRKSS